ncbi:hypothetical protein J7E81_21285 [Bacillus sp. ISL-18]|uniref:hypothetical protein n=1 Tax=Bacillus sp. ISL-18 TaxID=2819118 RepID=UPI001BEA8111|nr:hypothetical protein [Bacillus sp. ISL-18]MBT2657737.1 hypothetical protein [Bacillus sp. ISL-18]
MKGLHIIIILIIFAWPLNYLYQRQLGAVSFLLLAILFLYVSLKEMKKLKREKSQKGE